MDNRLADGGEAATVESLAVLFSEAAPDSVGLANGYGMTRTLGHHGASATNGLGGLFALNTEGSTLALGVEEQRRVFTAAGALELPIPNVGVRSG
jgi:hypothetical protein